MASGRILAVLGAALACGASVSPARGQLIGGDIITGAGTTSTHVKRFDAATLASDASFFAYDGVAGGVHVAAGDVNGDTFIDVITAPSTGTGPHVKAFSGASLAEVRSFFAYTPSFTGGVHVAAGDVNNDGFDDIYTAVAGGGSPHVKVFDGVTLAERHSFFAYNTAYTGGVRIAGGDVNNDGFDDIVTATAGGTAGHIKIFDGTELAETASFFPYGPSFTGGIYVAAGDVNGDGFDDVITGTDAGGTAHIKAFSGANQAELASFFAFPVGFNGGVRVAAADLTGDGRAEIIGGAGTASPTVKIFDGLSGAEHAAFLAYPGSGAGVFVAAADVPEPSSFLALAAAAWGWATLGRRRHPGER